MKPCSVILIRENAEQMTGSGCCGKLEGDNARPSGRDLFRLSDEHRRQVGTLYRAVRRFFPGDQVEVVEIDPRNQVYLSWRLMREAILYRPGILAALRTALQAFSLPAVVVNGRVVGSGAALPDPDQLLDTIRAALAADSRGSRGGQIAAAERKSH